MRLSSFCHLGRPAVFLVVLIPFAMPVEAAAQFGDLKKRAAQAVLCAGGAYGGYRLGAKLAEREIERLDLSAEQEQALTRAFQIGSALILCKGGAMLAGTVYERLSQRDLEAREREMEAAVAAADPGPRTYVLPDSGLEGTLTVEPSEVDGNRECRTVVDHLAEVEDGEPVMTRYCRDLPDGTYELDY